MGRPQKDINKTEFEKLCAMQCTQAEICAWFDVDDKTLTKWCERTYKKSFSEIFAVKRGTGKISLRRNQWKLSETNPTMAIWLGKQYLNQRDNRDVTVKQVIDPDTITAVEDFLNGDEGTSEGTDTD